MEYSTQLVAACQVKTEDGAFFVPQDGLAISGDGREFRLNRPVTKRSPNFTPPTLATF